MSDTVEKAIAVAVEVANRRDQGEQITDEEVIQRHADLLPHIERELKKIKTLRQARQTIQAEESSPVEEPTIRDVDEDNVKSPPAFDDFRLTVLASIDEVEEEDEWKEYTESVSTLIDIDLKKAEINETKDFRPLHRPATAILRVYHDNQRDFQNMVLHSHRTVIGRSSGDVLIPYDSQISTEHAAIIRMRTSQGWDWYLRDLDSTNGTFVAISQARLHDGDELLMGQQRYRFSLVGKEAWLEHVIGKKVVDSMQLASEGTIVGRDWSNSLDAFWDEYLDRKHAFIGISRQGFWHVKNLRSINGVWFRIREQRLFQSCFFQIGEQRFGFCNSLGGPVHTAGR